MQRSDDDGATWQPPVRVNAAAEPVAAEGENRPKLAFGPRGEIYVTWTSPTSAQFTGDIRFARSLDGGKTWSTPAVVHRDRQLITHRFESLLVDPKGRLWAAWVDKRDLKVAEDAGRTYRGAAIYYAYSDDRGATWSGDTKLADSSCECCRIALATDAQGRVAAMWRHVFEPNERDHAFAFLGTAKASVERATVDRWRIDACPHHGPSLAFGPDGTRHAVWFNQVDGQGRAFYGHLTDQGPSQRAEVAGRCHARGRRGCGPQRRHRVEALRRQRHEDRVADLQRRWKEFRARPVVADRGRLRSAASGEGKGQRMLLVWRNADGIAVRDVAAPALDTRVKPFESRHAGRRSSSSTRARRSGSCCGISSVRTA